MFDSKTLYVEYKDSGLYQYDNVPSEIYHGLRRVKSKGTYINKYVVGKYKFRHLSD